MNMEKSIHIVYLIQITEQNLCPCFSDKMFKILRNKINCPIPMFFFNYLTSTLTPTAFSFTFIGQRASGIRYLLATCRSPVEQVSAGGIKVPPLGSSPAW